MQSRLVSLSLCAALAVACRSGGESPPPAEPAQSPSVTSADDATPEPEVVPALPTIPVRPAPAAQAGDPAAGGTDARAQRFAALEQEHNDAMNAYYEALQKALGDEPNPSAEQWRKVSEEVKQPDLQAYIARARELLDEEASDITAFRVLTWMLGNAGTPEVREFALAQLEQHHMDRIEMGELCYMLVQDGRGLLDKLLADSPHVEVRGQACLALAEGLKQDIDIAGRLQRVADAGAELEGMQSWLGPERVAALQALDPAQAHKDLEQIYERILREFPDVPASAGAGAQRTLGQEAEAALYELRNLAVGKLAPEIEGVDLDQVAFKLSDYRGKVVLLDFWGNW